MKVVMSSVSLLLAALYLVGPVGFPLHSQAKVLALDTDPLSVAEAAKPSPLETSLDRGI